MDSALGSINGWVPVLGGFGAVLWVLWRLFWKVDRRSQQDIAIKDAEITKLNKDVEREKTLRYSAEEKAAKAEAREKSLESQISDLSDQIKELRAEVERLRIQQAAVNKIQGGTP